MRQPPLLLVMGLLLLSITSFPSPDLLRASAIEQELKQTGQILLVEGPELGAVQSSPATEVPPASPASEAEQKEQASGDVQERGLRDDSVLAPKGEIRVAPLEPTTTVTCPTISTVGSWTNDVLAFQGNINTLPAPYWLARNSNPCNG